MLALIQRVAHASVAVDDRTIGSIARGFLVLLGVHRDDTDRDADWIADRIPRLRVFTDDAGKMNLALPQVAGAVLVVPNFTLCADASRGNRPSFDAAMPPDRAREMWLAVCARIAAAGVPVEKGEFGAHMHVALENDGPVTILLNSRDMPRP
jgi:D-tyrosyl-tRNA(Tyr) deacylase